MSLLGKIKYFFDGSEEAEESGLILSRRKFFIASAAMLVVANNVNGVHVSECGKWSYSIGEGTDFFSPGVSGILEMPIEVQRYAEETARLVKNKFVFKPMYATIHLSEEDIKVLESVNGKAVQEVPFYRYEISDIKTPRNPILQHAAKRLGYRGKRM